ncbi:MAG: TIGR04255 family protein, partial [Armatimonadota bacterium]|nr:TIGR04255 family protein [Armatimonadota bacterium]
MEAVCEFRLGRAVRWDLTVPGLLYERLKGEFPEREQRLIQEVEVASSPQVLQQTIRVHEAVLF